MKLIFLVFLSITTLSLCVQSLAYSMELRSEQDRRREVCTNVGGMFETAAALRDEGAPEHTVAGVMAGYSAKWAPEITLELAEKIVKTVYSDPGFLIARGVALKVQMRQTCIDGNIPYLKFSSSASVDKKTTKKQDCLLLAGTLASIPIWRDNGVSLMKVQSNMAEALKNTEEGKGNSDLWSGMASDIYRSKVSTDDVYVGLRKRCDKMHNQTKPPSITNDKIEQTYGGVVAHRIKSFWVLPEMRKWDSNLLSQVAITINKDGEVVNIQFDQRSKDPLFDQFVEKTIYSAAPMPRFPALMQQDTTEVGLRFRPSDLGN